MKRDFAMKIAGSIVKKYKFTNKMKTLTTTEPLSKINHSNNVTSQRMEMKNVSSFFVKDDNSTLTPGKKQTITIKKIKKTNKIS